MRLTNHCLTHQTDRNIDKEDVLMKSKMLLGLPFQINIFHKKVISFSLILSAFLAFLIPSFAQDDTPEEYIVKVAYFISKDREPQKLECLST